MAITDMEAGLEHLKRGTLEHTDILVILVEPYFKSLDAAGRIVELARNLGVPIVYAVANKVQSVRDEEAVRSFCATKGLPILAIVPLDDEVSEAERQGRAPFDFAPGAAAVAAVRNVAREIFDGPVPAPEERVARRVGPSRPRDASEAE